jgi:hypothetical protein
VVHLGGIMRNSWDERFIASAATWVNEWHVVSGLVVVVAHVK